MWVPLYDITGQDKTKQDTPMGSHTSTHRVTCNTLFTTRSNSTICQVGTSLTTQSMFAMPKTGFVFEAAQLRGEVLQFVNDRLQAEHFVKWKRLFFGTSSEFT